MYTFSNNFDCSGSKCSHCVDKLNSFSITLFPGSCTECIFPEYVQSPMDENGEPSPWHTKVWWLNLRHEPKLREMQEVYVHRSQMWSQRQNNRWSCEHQRTKRLSYRAISEMFGGCSEKYLLYNRTCLGEERFNTFKVIQYGPSRCVYITFAEKEQSRFVFMYKKHLNLLH